MDIDVTGKVAIITGGSRGIGAALARDYLDRGMKVATCSRGPAAIHDSSNSWSRSLDVTDDDAFRAFADEAVERFGPIDLLINNAGLLEPIAPLRSAPLEQIRRLIDVNVIGVIIGSQWFVTHRRHLGGGGVLINISSGASTSPYYGWSAYCASKAAVDRFTECVQVEEEDVGLRAHALAPGIVDTHMQELIRATTEAQFPMVEKFREFKAVDAFNTEAFVARELLKIAFDPAAKPSGVVVRLPAEKG